MPLDQIYFITLCVILGLTSGLLGGLLGIGGGVVLVPGLAFYYAAVQRYSPDEILLVSVGTSLACIGFTSASSAFAQHRTGMIDWSLFRKLVVFFVLGSFTAGFIAPWLPEQVFRAFIGLFLTCVGVIMFSRWQPNPGAQFPGYAGSGLIGLSGGTAAGLAGIAGGNIIVPTLVYFNIPVHTATATSSAMGVPIAAVGAFGYWLSSGGPAVATASYIDLAALPGIILCALVAAPVGVKIAHKLPAARLKKGFGVLLLLVGARILYGLTAQ